MTSKEGAAKERWQEVDLLDQEIKRLRDMQDKALSNISKHRKVVDEIQDNLPNLPEEEKASAKKAIKEAKDQWTREEAVYKKAVRDLTELELRKQSLMEKLKREDHQRERERDSNEELIKQLQEKLKTKDGDGGRNEGEVLIDLIKTISEATRGPASSSSSFTGGPPRTRSLANLPILAKPGGFMEHLTKLETYFRINEVSKDADKKDILMLSLSAEVSSRTQGIDASTEPFSAQTWREFAESVRSRMIPKASASILRTQFESMKQEAGEYAVDYLVKKNALFLKAFPGDTRGERAMPVSYLVRHLIEGLFSEDLRSEIWREVRGGIDINDERDLDAINEAFDELLQATNLTLDFVRRNLNVKENTDKKGLSVVSQTDNKPDSQRFPRTMNTSYVNMAEEGEEEAEWTGGDEEYDWAEGEEGGVEDSEEPLSEEVISYCELIEDEDQAAFWNSEVVNEIKGGAAGGGGGGGEERRACWTCGSLMHFKRQCPQRLKAVTNRVNALTQRSSSRGRYPGGGGARRTWSARRRPAGRRGGSAVSSYAPFGRSSSGYGRFYPAGQQPTWFPSAPRTSQQQTDKRQHHF